MYEEPEPAPAPEPQPVYEEPEPAPTPESPPTPDAECSDPVSYYEEVKKMKTISIGVHRWRYCHGQPAVREKNSALVRRSVTSTKSLAVLCNSSVKYMVGVSCRCGGGRKIVQYPLDVLCCAVLCPSCHEYCTMALQVLYTRAYRRKLDGGTLQTINSFGLIFCRARLELDRIEGGERKD